MREGSIQLGDNPNLEKLAVEILRVRGTKNTLDKLEKEKKQAFDKLMAPLKEEFEGTKDFRMSAVTVTISAGSTVDTKAMREHLLKRGVDGGLIEEAVEIATKANERVLIKWNKEAAEEEAATAPVSH